MNRKLRILKTELKNLKNIVVAYSGGVDSTFLLKVARDTLPCDKILAVTEDSVFCPASEIKFAKKMAKKLGIKHIIIKQNPLADPKIASNPVDRCYWCKKEIFKKITNIAKKRDIKHIIDGTNFDDIRDFRPGIRACKEYNVHSPLKDAEFTKKDIRNLSKKYILPTWDKPSLACLASRFPYGDKITEKGLKMVEQAEAYLLRLGFKNVRIRHYRETARIEIDKESIKLFANSAIREKIVEKLKQIGYTYITIDLEGYRTGSLNTTSKRRKK